MKKWLKRLSFVAGITAVIVVVALYEGDIPKQIVDAKYSSPASQFLTLESGARIHYRDEGLEDGRPVVLIHGSNASLHTWEPWIEILGREYRTISLDLPGHGLTGKVPDRDYSVANQVAAVNEIVEHLGVDRFVLGGNSMGGGVTWRYVLQYPRKIEAMILVDAVGLPQWSAEIREASSKDDNGGPRVFRLLQKPWFRAIGRYMDPWYLINQGVRSAYSDQSAVTDELIQRYYDLALREGSREATMDRFAGYSLDALDSVDPAEFILPTLILWGRDDALIPVDVAEKFDSFLPNTSLVIYDNVGHAPMEEIPERSAADVLTFLKKNKGNTETTPEHSEVNAVGT